MDAIQFVSYETTSLARSIHHEYISTSYLILYGVDYLALESLVKPAKTKSKNLYFNSLT